jgi:hypothetical protein
MLVQPPPIGGFRQVEEISLLPRCLTSGLLRQAHVVIQVTILDRELGQSHTQSRVRMPQRLIHFWLGGSSAQRHGSHAKDWKLDLGH